MGSLACRTTALALAVLAGCRPAEQVRSYTVDAESPSAATTAAAAPSPETAPADRGEPTHRMMAAIVPAAGQAWFVKGVGPIASVARVAGDLRALFESLRIEGDRPAWKTPDGWTEKPAEGMRQATLVSPADAPGVEVTVIGLPIVGEWSSQVLDNANRWLGQLGREPMTAATLEGKTTKLAAIDGGVLIDADGWFSGGMLPGGTPPFAGGASPMASRPTPPAEGPLRFATPTGWTDKPGSAMRLASLSTPGGAEVTAFAFPASAPAMSDPLENVNRWRGEVGLGPTTAEELASDSQKVPVSGQPGDLVELKGKAESTIAVMSVRGDSVWFFKLRGPLAEVAAQREAFLAWIDSVKIND
jgi:hypothetical protein